MRSRDRIATVVDREVQTLLRNRMAAAVAVAFFAVVVGLGGASTGSPGGFVSLSYDLLLPVEVLVPALAFAYAYQSVRGDDRRGELAVIRTYGVSRFEYVLGVFIGRTASVSAVVIVSLGAAGVVAGLGSESTVGFLATHQAGDTLVVYVRFVVFAVVYAAVTTAIALAVSAVTRTRQEALAGAVGGVVVVAVALDLALVTLVGADIIRAEVIAVFNGLSPASAFRGLVLEVAIQPALAAPPAVATASPLASAVGLFGWLVACVVGAAFAVWPHTEISDA
jgi:ABC-type transport system involved in multi-copper enzyme maturation permease subunit